ncbi:hypothetical protein BC831DRAFT_551651 [Entophlyctis helioformis]|nr:hypothetical protein BC831DRAFT_551651 [Entophlyctis helioformis]
MSAEGMPVAGIGVGVQKQPSLPLLPSSDAPNPPAKSGSRDNLATPATKQASVHNMAEDSHTGDAPKPHPPAVPPPASQASQPNLRSSRTSLRGSKTALAAAGSKDQLSNAATAAAPAAPAKAGSVNALNKTASTASIGGKDKVSAGVAKSQTALARSASVQNTADSDTNAKATSSSPKPLASSRDQLAHSGSASKLRQSRQSIRDGPSAPSAPAPAPVPAAASDAGTASARQSTASLSGSKAVGDSAAPKPTTSNRASVASLKAGSQKNLDRAGSSKDIPASGEHSTGPAGVAEHGHDHDHDHGYGDDFEDHHHDDEHREHEPDHAPAAKAQSSEKLVGSRDQLAKTQSAAKLTSSRDQIAKAQSAAKLTSSRDQLAKAQSSEKLTSSRDQLAKAQSSEKLVGSRDQLAKAQSSEKLAGSRDQLAKAQSAAKLAGSRDQLGGADGHAPDPATAADHDAQHDYADDYEHDHDHDAQAVQPHDAQEQESHEHAADIVADQPGHVSDNNQSTSEAIRQSHAALVEDKQPGSKAELVSGSGETPQSRPASRPVSRPASRPVSRPGSASASVRASRAELAKSRSQEALGKEDQPAAQSEHAADAETPNHDGDSAANGSAPASVRASHASKLDMRKSASNLRQSGSNLRYSINALDAEPADSPAAVEGAHSEDHPPSEQHDHDQSATSDHEPHTDASHEPEPQQEHTSETRKSVPNLKGSGSRSSLVGSSAQLKKSSDNLKKATASKASLVGSQPLARNSAANLAKSSAPASARTSTAQIAKASAPASVRSSTVSVAKASAPVSARGSVANVAHQEGAKASAPQSARQSTANIAKSSVPASSRASAAGSARNSARNSTANVARDSASAVRRSASSIRNSAAGIDRTSPPPPQEGEHRASSSARASKASLHGSKAGSKAGSIHDVAQDSHSDAAANDVRASAAGHLSTAGSRGSMDARSTNDVDERSGDHDGHETSALSYVALSLTHDVLHDAVAEFQVSGSDPSATYEPGTYLDHIEHERRQEAADHNEHDHEQQPEHGDAGYEQEFEAQHEEAHAFEGHETGEDAHKHAHFAEVEAAREDPQSGQASEPDQQHENVQQEPNEDNAGDAAEEYDPLASFEHTKLPSLVTLTALDLTDEVLQTVGYSATRDQGPNAHQPNAADDDEEPYKDDDEDPDRPPRIRRPSYLDKIAISKGTEAVIHAQVMPEAPEQEQEADHDQELTHDAQEHVDQPQSEHGHDEHEPVQEQAYHDELAQDAQPLTDAGQEEPHIEPHDEARIDQPAHDHAEATYDQEFEPHAESVDQAPLHDAQSEQHAAEAHPDSHAEETAEASAAAEYDQEFEQHADQQPLESHVEAQHDGFASDAQADEHHEEHHEIVDEHHEEPQQALEEPQQALQEHHDEHQEASYEQEFEQVAKPEHIEADAGADHKGHVDHDEAHNDETSGDQAHHEDEAQEHHVEPAIVGTASEPPAVETKSYADDDFFEDAPAQEKSPASDANHEGVHADAHDDHAEHQNRAQEVQADAHHETEGEHQAAPHEEAVAQDATSEQPAAQAAPEYNFDDFDDFSSPPPAAAEASASASASTEEPTALDPVAAAEQIPTEMDHAAASASVTAPSKQPPTAAEEQGFDLKSASSKTESLTMDEFGDIESMAFHTAMRTASASKSKPTVAPPSEEAAPQPSAASPEPTAVVEPAEPVERRDSTKRIVSPPPEHVPASPTLSDRRSSLSGSAGKRRSVTKPAWDAVETIQLGERGRESKSGNAEANELRASLSKIPAANATAETSPAPASAPIALAPVNTKKAMPAAAKRAAAAQAPPASRPESRMSGLSDAPSTLPSSRPKSRNIIGEDGKVNHTVVLADLRQEIRRLHSEIERRDSSIEQLKEHEKQLKRHLEEMKRLDQQNLEKNVRLLLARQKKDYQITIALLKRQIRHLKYQRNSLADPLIDIKYFPYLPRTEYSNSARKPPYGIIGNLPPRTSDYFALNPPEPTGNHPDSGHRWWWDAGHGTPHWAHLPPTRPATTNLQAPILGPRAASHGFDRPESQPSGDQSDPTQRPSNNKSILTNSTQSPIASPSGSFWPALPNQTAAPGANKPTAPSPLSSQFKRPPSHLASGPTSYPNTMTPTTPVTNQEAGLYDSASSAGKPLSALPQRFRPGQHAAGDAAGGAGQKIEGEVGDRVCVVMNDERCLGILKYVGPLETGNSGTWCGIQLDRPCKFGSRCAAICAARAQAVQSWLTSSWTVVLRTVGTHDGIVHGRKYFTCKENHGIFVRMDKVIVIKHTGSFVKVSHRRPHCAHAWMARWRQTLTVAR